MTREQYQSLLGLLNAEIAVYSQCVAFGSVVTVRGHQAKLAHLFETKAALNKLFFPQHVGGLTNGQTEEPECQTAQAA